MKKVVKWGQPVLRNPDSPLVKSRGGYASFQEMWSKAQERQKEQDKAHEYLNKAMPGLLAMFEFKVKNGEPFVVMRPLQYASSELVKSGNMEKYADTVKTVLPGTSLICKGFDSVLQEFIFVDGTGEEHAINVAERNKLLTQTDIFEIVKSYLEGKGE